jgi:Protein of unknown function (DUF3443)
MAGLVASHADPIAPIRSRILAGLAAIPIVLCPSGSAQPSGPDNVVSLRVRTPHSGFNRLLVSLTVCEPDTPRCATIDDVMVDTGSTGLRLEASAVPSWLRLPAFVGSAGKPLAECLHFLHDDAWGPLRRADLRMGGLLAADLPIQVIADDGQARPAACPTSTVRPTSNGTLGIGPNLLDCQGSCEQSASRPGVFVQDGGTWSPVHGPVAPASRLPNPVARFRRHGNGVVIELPMPPKGGSDELVGRLTFGVGTAPNNQLGAAHIIRVDQRGFVTTLYGGATFPTSTIDSGTETDILTDAALPRCEGMPWAFCVEPERQLRATIVGADGAQVTVTFKVGDYRRARNRSIGAWDGYAEAAEASQPTFVWGAPFFLGQRVSVIFDEEGVAGTGVKGPAYGIGGPPE